MKFDDLLAQVPSLSPLQLTKLRAAIQARKQLGGVAFKDIEPHHIPKANATDDGMLLNTLLKAVPNAGFGVDQLRGLSAYKSFSAKTQDLLDFFNRISGDTMEQRVLMGIGWRLLAHQIRNEGLVVSGGLLLRHAHRIPAVLDFHFPGYGEIGMLKLVLRHDLKQVLK